MTCWSSCSEMSLASKASSLRMLGGGDCMPREHGDGALSETERVELARLRTENTELRMQRDVLKRSVALWVTEAMGR